MTFMNVLPVLTLVLGAAISYIGSASLSRRDFLRQRRVEYLLSAYRVMESVSNRGGLTPEQAAKLEAAVADVFLLGSDDQQATLAVTVDRFAASQEADTGPILLSLRLSLRKELGLGPGLDRPVHLRIAE